MASIADLKESLSVAGGGAFPLVQKVISPLLVELVRKFAPTRIAFARQTCETSTYFFNQRTQLPRAQMVVEAPPTTGTGSVAATNSTYVQNSYPIMHYQSNGDISRFAQKVATVNGNLLDLEIEGAIMACGWLEEVFNIYGSYGATVNTYRPGWDGLRQLVDSKNRLDANGFPYGSGTQGMLQFTMLDALIDSVRGPYAQNIQGQQYFMLMSPNMQSKMVQLTQPVTRVGLERVRLQPMSDGGIAGAPVVIDKADPGVEVYSYRGIPIVETSFLSAPGQMSAVTLGQAASTTPFAASSTRYYVVTAITIYGETLASAEQSVTISTTGNKVNLSWSTPSIPDRISGNALPIIVYAIWEGATSGSETLLAIVPAFDASDNPVTSWSDLGAASISTSVFWQGGVNGDGVTYPNSYISANANGLGSENIYLVSRDPNLVVVPVVEELTPQMLAIVNARTRQFAITGDQTLAMRAGIFASCLERVRWA